MTTNDSDDVFKGWLSLIRQNEDIRYKYNNRKAHLEDLMDMFLNANISMEEAYIYKNRVVKALVTEEGMKGRNKHKNWKENTENDFEDAIQFAYNPLLKNQVIKKNLNYQPVHEIVNWAKSKFGENVPQDVLRDCHTLYHLFNMQFINDFYKRKVKKGVGS